MDGACDLWVKEDLGNKETEIIEETEEEIIADEDVPDAF